MTAIAETAYLQNFVDLQQGYSPNARESLQFPRKALFAEHGYQPPRNAMGVYSGERIRVFPEVNEQIHQECYQHLLVDRGAQPFRPFPDGFVTSVYGTNRVWMKEEHPDDFERMRQRMLATPDIAYKILGDPFLHPIMPFLSEANQDMMVKAGIQIFQDDLGFMPKGMWLPEAAVSATTLRVLYKNGYEFTVLQGHQLESIAKNPMKVPIRENGQVIGYMVVLCVDDESSQHYSHDDAWTENADEFLQKGEFVNGVAVASDLEMLGHHKPWRGAFFDRVTDPEVLAAAGFSPMDIKEEVQRTLHDPDGPITEVREDSSWSCVHQLGRWKGADYCDCPEGPRGIDTHKGYKQYLRREVDEVGLEIDTRLDVIDPSWRAPFIEFFLRTRKSMYQEGDLQDDIRKASQEIPLMRNHEVVVLFTANLARLTAETSCAWFFAGERAEHRFAALHTQEAKQLLAVKVQQEAA